MDRLAHLKIGVLMGGTSSERDISLKTGQAVLDSMKRQGYQAEALEMAPAIAAGLSREKYDLVFVALHGPEGEDGTVQGMLEILGIPYTGSGVLASALGMDKVASRKIFATHGIAVPAYHLLWDHPLPPGLLEKLGWPVVVKPVDQGSSLGVSIVPRSEELEEALRSAREYGPQVLIEQYIDGMEVHVGVLGEEPLGAIEIQSRTSFYDYAAKYAPGMSEHVFPARLAPQVYEKALKVGMQAHSSLGCRGYSRVDLLVSKEGTPYVLEINTLPGMTETSLLPEIARGVGIDFDKLIHTILVEAVESRPGGIREREHGSSL